MYEKRHEEAARKTWDPPVFCRYMVVRQLGTNAISSHCSSWSLPYKSSTLLARRNQRSVSNKVQREDIFVYRSRIWYPFLSRGTCEICRTCSSFPKQSQKQTGKLKICGTDLEAPEDA